MVYLLKLIIPHIDTNSYNKFAKFDKKIKPCKAFMRFGVSNFRVYPDLQNECTFKTGGAFFDMILSVNLNATIVAFSLELHIHKKSTKNRLQFSGIVI